MEFAAAGLTILVILLALDVSIRRQTKELHEKIQVLHKDIIAIKEQTIKKG